MVWETLLLIKILIETINFDLEKIETEDLFALGI